MPATYSASLAFEKGIGWYSFRDLTSSEFSKKFKQYKEKGYMMIDIDVYKVGSALRYSMIWRENTEQRGWAEFRNMSSETYSKKWKEFRDKGYRPHDIESYRINGQQKYAGIWVQNKEGYSWSSKRNLKASEYGEYFKTQKSKGRRMIDMEAYQTSGGLRYSAIWVQNKENISWAQYRDMSRSAYQKKIDDYTKKGYIVVDYETYRSNGKRRYAAIWEKRSGYAYQVRTNRTEKEYANLWREYRDEGYRLLDFERQGSDYAGVWIENASRYRYSKKKKIDNLMKKYRKDNNLPGISVAIVKHGKMIYQKGFGWADKEKKKVAHAKTIYSAASISKVIGGTLATKLHDEQRLRNGKKIQLNLNDRTRKYLINVARSNGDRVTLPARHKHTLKQLFAHLGCIQHYSGPEPDNGHYVRAIDALPDIWNADFVSPCTRGTTRSYSTHALTYIAAVLEKVTGKTSAQLIRSELAKPYQLSSMRALWGSTTVPANYERAVPYKDNNSPTSTSDNSWKIFGGGIEASPLDLAWFGWKLLDGKIVQAKTRDNLLWKRVNANQVNGIAWEVRTRDGKNVAEHSGSWTGAMTRLRIYRDDGLVIALMSNRRDHTVGSLSSLASDIADEVL